MSQHASTNVENASARRRFLRASAALAASAFALRYSAHASADTKLDTVRLSDTMIALLGPNGNSVAAAGSDGVILVDGGSASWSQALLATVAEAFKPQPVRALFNTHWHPEQTGSNVALGRGGVQIIAHENTKLWLGTEVWVRWSNEKYPPLAAEGIPSKTFYDSGSVAIGSRSVDYRYLLNAHTDGDICVYFRDDNVLATGGAVSNDGWPVIDWWTGGWIGGMLDAYDTMLDLADQNTRIVPSRGPVMSLAQLKSQRDMYATIFERLQTMLRQSFGTDEVIAARPTAEFDAQWGDPQQFVALAFDSLWGHIRDVYDTRLKTIP